MNYKQIGKFIGSIMAIEAVFMLPSLFMALFARQRQVFWGFAVAVGAAAVIAVVLLLTARGAERSFFTREAMVSTGLSWIALSVIGCLPFVISGAIPNFGDALFETISGFTTTGASVLSDVESLPHAILFWRSFTHWLGGMGVLVLLLAIAPDNARNAGLNMQVMRAESAGPSIGKLVPKIKHSTRILYSIYLTLTVVNFVFLLFGNMTPFEALCTALGTAGTGGFGILNDSMASFSPYVQNVTSIFMLLFGVNFAIYYLCLLRRFRTVGHDEELRAYGLIVAAATIIITINVRSLYGTFGETLRHAFFQVSSIITTTGYSTTDFDLWPNLSKAILLVLMLFGACAGSTCGGLKCSRVMLLCRAGKRSIQKMLHPNKVQVIRINGTPVDERIVTAAITYFIIYAVIMAVSFLVVAGDPACTTLTSSASAVISCLNNIGPGFDAFGPTCNFGAASLCSKIVLMIDMLAGRLEIYPLLLLFLPGTWAKKA